MRTRESLRPSQAPATRVSAVTRPGNQGQVRQSRLAPPLTPGAKNLSGRSGQSPYSCRRSSDESCLNRRRQWRRGDRRIGAVARAAPLVDPRAVALPIPRERLQFSNAAVMPCGWLARTARSRPSLGRQSWLRRRRRPGAEGTAQWAETPVRRCRRQRHYRGYGQSPHSQVHAEGRPDRPGCRDRKKGTAGAGGPPEKAQKSTKPHGVAVIW